MNAQTPTGIPRMARPHAAILSTTLACAGFQAHAGDDRDRVIPTDVVVRLAPGTSLQSVLDALGPLAPGLAPTDQIPGRPIHLLTFEAEGAEPPPELELAIDAMVKSGTLVWGEFGYEAETGEGRTDSLWVTGVGIDAATYREQFAGELLGLAAAHSMARGAGVMVAIVDSGLAGEHPLVRNPISPAGVDLVDGLPVMRDPLDGIDNDGDGLTDEMAGHGTFVASLIGLTAPHATLLPIRVLDTEGRTTVYRMAKGIAAAIDGGAHVINMSVGTTYNSVALEDLAEEAQDAGITLVASLGNLNRASPEEYPAAANGAFAVASTTHTDHRAEFSNFGTFAWISAPGSVQVMAGNAVDPTASVFGAVPGGHVGAWSGTSFSTAFVAGAAALVRGQHPEWPTTEVALEDIADTIMSTLAVSATPIDALNPGFEQMLGAGRVHVAAAVALGPPVHPADLNGDRSIDGSDITALLAAWGDCDGCVADIDANGTVDGNDLTSVLAAWSR